MHVLTYDSSFQTGQLLSLCLEATIDDMAEALREVKAAKPSLYG